MKERYSLGDRSIKSMKVAWATWVAQSEFGLHLLARPYHLIDELTVYENIETPFRLYRNVSSSERKSYNCSIWWIWFNIGCKKRSFPVLNFLVVSQQVSMGLLKSCVQEAAKMGRVAVRSSLQESLHSAAKDNYRKCSRTSSGRKHHLIQGKHSCLIKTGVLWQPWLNSSDARWKNWKVMKAILIWFKNFPWNRRLFSIFGKK